MRWRVLGRSGVWTVTMSAFRKRDLKRCIPHAQFALHFGRRAKLVIIDYLHAEPARPARHGFFRSGPCRDAEGLSVHVQPKELGGLPALPFSRAEKPLPLAHPPACRQYERKSEVGRCLVEHFGGVRHRNPARRGGVQIHIVITHPVVGDYAETRGRRPSPCRRWDPIPWG